MKLVPASYKRELLTVGLVLMVGLAAAFLASSGDADARPAPRPSATSVIPDGSYGVYKPARGEYVYFTVRNRKVRNLEFQIRIVCQASDEPTAEERFFTGGARAPEGRTVPANGKLIMNWQEDGGGRWGRVHTELKFGARDVANFGVIVPEARGDGPDATYESCDGVSALRFNRGFELPPLP
jgi:hypothetical protein